jgi:hypothetical protein
MKQTRNAYKLVVGNLYKVRPFGRTWHRWEDNSLKWIGCEDVNWIELSKASL